MHFTAGSTYNAVTPMIWDTHFWMPAGKTLSFNVPMYTGVADTGVTAEVWIVDPHNDPLMYDLLWVNTPAVSTARPTAGATTGNVLARSPMPTATRGVWYNVQITVPAQTRAKELIARIIVKGTTASQNCYAYIDSMEAALLKKKRIFL
jgi:hypothetical protein